MYKSNPRYPRKARRKLNFGSRAAVRRTPYRDRARNSNVSVPRLKLGFPQSLRSTLRYTTIKQLDVPSLANVQYESFRANGLVDPEVSLGGHSARGLDQLMASYDTFTVLSSKISVNWSYQGYNGPQALDGTASFLLQTIDGQSGAPACPPVMVGIYKGTTALPVPSTAAEVMEHDRVVWRSMNQNQAGVLTRSGTNIGSWFGKYNIVGAEGFTGTAALDPTEQPQYTIWAGRTNGVTNGKCLLTAYVTIEFDVVFTEPKPLSAS